MSSLLQPLHLLLMLFAGWVNRHQLDLIDYLQEENRVLKERLGGRPIRFTDAGCGPMDRPSHFFRRGLAPLRAGTRISPLSIFLRTSISSRRIGAAHFYSITRT